MPFQNRVDPFGTIAAVADRGTMMGNRGGRIHRPDQTLSRRQWASKAWIICVTEFKNRQRPNMMMPNSYTELFFLDEATAMAAGHRPCYECRRADANRFADCWRQGHDISEIVRAGMMDDRLHEERRVSCRTKIPLKTHAGRLPDGAMIVLDNKPWLVCRGGILEWSFAGYGKVRTIPDEPVEVLTPPSTLKTLVAGYTVALHPSAL